MLERLRRSRVPYSLQSGALARRETSGAGDRQQEDAQLLIQRRPGGCSYIHRCVRAAFLMC